MSYGVVTIGGLPFVSHDETANVRIIINDSKKISFFMRKLLSRRGLKTSDIDAPCRVIVGNCFTSKCESESTDYQVHLQNDFLIYHYYNILLFKCHEIIITIIDAEKCAIPPKID